MRCKYNVTLRCDLATVIDVEKQYVLHILSVYLYPLISSMQCECVTLSCVACLALQYFSALYHIRYDFRKKKSLNTKCILISSTIIFSETLIILRRTERDMIKMSSCLHAEYPLFLLDFKETWNFSTVFRKALEHQISRNSFQWEQSCSTPTYGRTWS